MTSTLDKAHSEGSAPREARVLLVDDDRELCQMLTEYLDAEHFEVKSVHDGSDALAELQANDFEILILDVMLPSVSGFDVLRKLGAGVPVGEVLAEHPRLTLQDIQAAQTFAADYLADEELVYR